VRAGDGSTLHAAACSWVGHHLAELVARPQLLCGRRRLRARDRVCRKEPERIAEARLVCLRGPAASRSPGRRTAPASSAAARSAKAGKRGEAGGGGFQSSAGCVCPPPSPRAGSGGDQQGLGGGRRLGVAGGKGRQEPAAAATGVRRASALLRTRPLPSWPPPRRLCHPPGRASAPTWLWLRVRRGHSAAARERLCDRTAGPSCWHAMRRRGGVEPVDPEWSSAPSDFTPGHPSQRTLSTSLRGPGLRHAT